MDRDLKLLYEIEYVLKHSRYLVLLGRLPDSEVDGSHSFDVGNFSWIKGHLSERVLRTLLGPARH